METQGFDLDSAVCFSLYSTTHAVLATYRELLAPHGLTYQQFLTLHLLSTSEPLSVGGISQHLSLEPSAASGLVRRLAETGLVSKERLPQDQRTVVVTLTRKGRSLLEGLAAVPACFAEATGLSQSAAGELLRILGSLKARLTLAPGTPTPSTAVISTKGH